MGMSTRYKLTIKTRKPLPEYEYDKFYTDYEQEFLIYRWIANEMDTIDWDEFHDAIIDEVECKWYNHDIDMQCLSRQFPDVLFVLHGVPESKERNPWITYYFDGMKQYTEAEMRYEAFDFEKLKN